MRKSNTYIAGLTFITWGLVLITPLYLHFRISDAFMVIPLMCLFLVTGFSILKGRKFSWTLGLLLGSVLLVHFTLSQFNDIFRKTDLVRRYRAPEIVFLTIWSLLTVTTLYSTLRLLSNDVREKMNIGSRQYRWTLAASTLTGVLLSFFLMHHWYWI
jgi:hypothetical protein